MVRSIPITCAILRSRPGDVRELDFDPVWMPQVRAPLYGGVDGARIEEPRHSPDYPPRYLGESSSIHYCAHSISIAAFVLRQNSMSLPRLAVCAVCVSFHPPVLSILRAIRSPSALTVLQRGWFHVGEAVELDGDAMTTKAPGISGDHFKYWHLIRMALVHPHS